MKCTVVMYHYVRNMHKTDYPQIKGLLIDKFKKQLDYLQENYEIISLKKYQNYLSGKETIPSNSCILSFDDGLKDHYTHVFPILKERGLNGCFFIPTKPLVDHNVLPVQKSQFILAKLGTQKFVEEFNALLNEKFPNLVEKFFVDEMKQSDRKNWYDDWDDTLTSNLKFSIGNLQWNEKNQILDDIFSKHFDNEEKFSQELYLNWDEIKEMIDAGMSFGSHSHSHPDLTSLNQEDLQREIIHSKKIMEHNLNRPIEFFCYPYGGCNEQVIASLKEAGYVCALNTEAAINKSVVDLFKIQRFDTNHLPQ